jgi:hypothetical protein
MIANLYREFPVEGATPLATVGVDPDGSWAFTGVSAWQHYFVQVGADFGQPLAIGAVVGPLGVPSTGSTVVTVKPVQLTVVEQALSGGAMQLASALAYVFDPASGALVQDATVTISVGGASVPMPWKSVGGTQAYSVTFATPPAAQASYAITTTLPGSQPTFWQLQASTPSFTPSLSAPANGVTVAKGQPLSVTWTAQPAADEEILEFYTQQQGGWQQAYVSPHPDDADVTQETVPGSYVVAGTPLLVDVLFATASCPSSADGCVVSNEVAASQITAQ